MLFRSAARRNDAAAGDKVEEAKARFDKDNAAAWQKPIGVHKA